MDAAQPETVVAAPAVAEPDADADGVDDDGEVYEPRVHPVTGKEGAVWSSTKKKVLATLFCIGKQLRA